MNHSIVDLLKNGQLKDAVAQLEVYARQIGADQETLSDILVLQNNLSDLHRQEKRRKIDQDNARDARTRYSYEITDILDKLKPESGESFPLGHPGSDSAATLPADRRSPAAASNNIQISVNVNVSNVITNEMRSEITGIKDSFEALGGLLRQQEDKDSQLAAEQVEQVLKITEEAQGAKEKSQIETYLARAENFFKRLADGNDALCKAISVTKDGVKTAQKLARHYNSLAQWVGLPVIPSLLLGSNVP